MLKHGFMRGRGYIHMGLMGMAGIGRLKPLNRRVMVIGVGLVEEYQWRVLPGPISAN